MRTVPAAVVTLVLALTVSPALARREWVHVDDYNGKILVVQATINQSISGRFILDTGATYCVVSKETAAAANLDGRRDGPKTRMATASGRIVEATLGKARRVEMGSAIAREVDVAVVDVDPAPGFRGLIGLSFLRNFRYSVDTDKGQLMLEY